MRALPVAVVAVFDIFIPPSRKLRRKAGSTSPTGSTNVAAAV